MSRPPRHFIPDIPLHVIQRGNNRQDCFYDKRDYIVYLDKLQHYAQKYDIAIHSFVLMTNHVHLLLTPKDIGSVSKLFQSLGTYYVRYINSTYKRTGTLWEGRFRASLVQSELYFLTLSRYIELNPVRAGITLHPSDYHWSSFQSNALGKTISLVTQHSCYIALGKTPHQRQAAYQALFEQQIPGDTLKKIRQTTNKCLQIGNDDFKQELENYLGIRLPPFKRGGNQMQKKDKVE